MTFVPRIQHGAFLADDDALVAFLLAENRGFNVHKAVFPFRERRDFHRRAVGNLLLQAEQQFFADQFGTDLPLRLIRDHVIGEKVRPFFGILLQFPQELLQALSAFGRNRKNRVKAVPCAVNRHDLQQFLLFDRINLIDYENRRQLLFFDSGDQRLFLRPDGRDRLHHQQHAVHIRDALAHNVDHIIAEFGTRLVEARCVHQDKLGFTAAHNRGDPVAGCLRLIGDNGDFFPDQSFPTFGLPQMVIIALFVTGSVFILFSVPLSFVPATRRTFSRASASLNLSPDRP